MDIDKDVYEIFQAAFPMFMEVADETTTKQTELAISSIVISEVGETDVALQYIDSFRIENLTQQKRVVRFIPASEKIKTLESGIKTFSMKDKMLQAGKPGVKISKKGFLYKTVPLNHDMDKQSAEVGKKQEAIRAEIKEILSSANFALKQAFRNTKTNQYTVIDKAPGIVRTRVFESKASFNQGKKADRTHAVIFRTMSNRPGTSAWIHPGVPGKNVKNKIDSWLRQNEDAIFNEVLDNLIEQFFGA